MAVDFKNLTSKQVTLDDIKHLKFNLTAAFVVWLVVVVAVGLVGITQFASLSVKNQKETEALAITSQDLDKNIANLDALKQSYQKITDSSLASNQTDEELILSALPTEFDENDIYLIMNQLARQSSVELGNAFTENKNSKEALINVPPKGVQTISFSSKINDASISNFLKFLENSEGSLRTLDITSMDITISDNSGIQSSSYKLSDQSVKVKLNLTAYFSPAITPKSTKEVL